MGLKITLMKKIFILGFPLLIYLMACNDDNEAMQTDNPSVDENALAEVVSVAVSGEENQYTFSVGIKSPDTGCNQYADWWEVISEDETLIYRRVLAHSHVNEQPFVRSGGAVNISKDQSVYVRAHMNTSGYGTVVYKGAVTNGFEKANLDKEFASAVEKEEPLPTECAF